MQVMRLWVVTILVLIPMLFSASGSSENDDAGTKLAIAILHIEPIEDLGWGAFLVPTSFEVGRGGPEARTVSQPTSLTKMAEAFR